MNNNQNRPVEKLLEGLSQHFQSLSVEDRKAELNERGIDADSFLKEAHAIIEKHQKAQRLAWMQVADQNIASMHKVDTAIVSWVNKKAEEIGAAFAQHLKSPARQKTLAFRNKGDLSVEDMARILDDYERLKMNSDPASDKKQ